LKVATTLPAESSRIFSLFAKFCCSMMPNIIYRTLSFRMQSLKWSTQIQSITMLPVYSSWIEFPLVTLWYVFFSKFGKIYGKKVNGQFPTCIVFHVPSYITQLKKMSTFHQFQHLVHQHDTPKTFVTITSCMQSWCSANKSFITFQFLLYSFFPIKQSASDTYIY
jgi:hypothetical protein